MKLAKFLFYLAISLITSISLLCDANIISVNDLIGIFGINNKNDNFIIYLIPYLLFFVYSKFYNCISFDKNTSSAAFLLSIISLTGLSLTRYDDLRFLYANHYQAFFSLIVLLGFFIFYMLLLTVLLRQTDRICMSKKTEPGNFTGSTFSKTFLLLFFAWLPYFILYFPGNGILDAYIQLNQYFDRSQLSTHHPILSTFLFGFIAELGKNIYSDNLGFALCILFQYVIFVLSITYSLYFLSKIGISKKLYRIITLFYAFFPLFPLYATCLMKDVLYFSFVLLFFVIFSDILLAINKNKSVNLKYSIYLFLTSLMASLLRNNGIFICGFSILAASLIFKNKKLFYTFFAIIFSYAIVFNGMVIGTGARYGSIKEALSIPFQQTARCIKYEKSTITTDEEKAIDSVLDFQSVGEKYNPNISDPVKSTFKENGNLKEYFKTWLKLMVEHPLTCLEAALCNCYSYYYILGKSKEKPLAWTIMQTGPNHDTGVLKITYTFNFDTIREYITALIGNLTNVPFLALFVNSGFYTYITIFILLLLIKHKELHLICLLVPNILNIFVCTASPVNGSMRYYMPNVLITPILCYLIFFLLSEKYIPIKK